MVARRATQGTMPRGAFGAVMLDTLRLRHSAADVLAIDVARRAAPLPPGATQPSRRARFHPVMVR
jgi:hypothetical protein